MDIWPKKQAAVDPKWGRACILTLLLWAAPALAQVGALPAGSGVQDSVSFDADRVEYDLQTGRVCLTGNALIRYRDVELSAARIVYDRKAQLVEAESLPDSTGETTVGLPLFIRRGERFSGTRMVYNLETEQGRVQGGRAVHQRKFYRGEHILLDSQKDLHALELSLSTCNLDHVHYDFLCQNLKVLENDKAIGRSVTFRIGPVPLFWLPFFVFPVKTERHSGLLTPGVGSNSRDGITVRNLGYYFAPSDYWDATLRATFRERGGFLLDSRFIYAVRNRLSGSADLGFENLNSATGSTSRSWRLNLQHQQRVSPTLNIRGNGQFSSSSNFDRRNSDNLYGYLNQQLRSSFSLDKRWPDANRSLDASATYYRDLSKRRNSFQGFPRLSFRQGRRSIFGRPEGASSQDLSWYRSIYYSLSGNLANDFTRDPSPAGRVINLIVNRLKVDAGRVTPEAHLVTDLGAGPQDLADLAGELQNEFGIPISGEDLEEGGTVGRAIEVVKGRLNTEDLTLQSLLSVNSQHRILGWLDFNPSLSANQRLSRNDRDRPTRQESYTGGLSSGANFYGIFRPHLGRLRGIRHRLTPRMNFRYSQSATVRGGTFGFGGTKSWGDPARSLNLNLGNTFELKTETDGDVRRFTLGTLNLSTGYDFDRTLQKWRPLRTTASVKPNRRMDVRMSMAHSLYDPDGNRSLLKPRLRNFSVTSNFRFQGSRGDVPADSEPRSGHQIYPSDFGFEGDLYGGGDDVTQPWRLSLTHYFDLRKDPDQKRSWVKLDLGVNPTPSWRANYGVNYDLLPNRRTVAQNFTLYRDLHCWESRFTWYPTGFNKGFFFKINIKEIPQIKLEHRRGGFGI